MFDLKINLQVNTVLLFGFAVSNFSIYFNCDHIWLIFSNYFFSMWTAKIDVSSQCDSRWLNCQAFSCASNAAATIRRPWQYDDNLPKSIPVEQVQGHASFLHYGRANSGHFVGRLRQSVYRASWTGRYTERLHSGLLGVRTPSDFTLDCSLPVRRYEFK